MQNRYTTFFMLAVGAIFMQPCRAGEGSAPSFSLSPLPSSSSSSNSHASETSFASYDDALHHCLQNGIVLNRLDADGRFVGQEPFELLKECSLTGKRFSNLLSENFGAGLPLMIARLKIFSVFLPHDKRKADIVDDVVDGRQWHRYLHEQELSDDLPVHPLTKLRVGSCDYEAIDLENGKLTVRHLGGYEETFDDSLRAHLLRALLHPNQGVGALWEAGCRYFSLRDCPRSIQWCKRALAKQDKGTVDYALILGDIGHAYYHSGAYAEALPFLQEASDLLQKYQEDPNNNEGIIYGKALAILADIHLRLGEKDKVIALWQESADVLRNEDAAHGFVFHNLAMIYSESGNYESSLYYAQRAAETLLIEGDSMQSSQALNLIGYIHERTDEIPRAISYYRQALQRSIGENPYPSANMLYLFATAKDKMGIVDQEEIQLCAQRLFGPDSNSEALTGYQRDHPERFDVIQSTARALLESSNEI